MADFQANDLIRFQRFIAITVETGDQFLTPEEVLDVWRAQNPLPKDLEETKSAIEEALRDMEAGDHGVPLGEFDRNFRIQRNIPAE
jgi:hypothetical protein